MILYHSCPRCAGPLVNDVDLMVAVWVCVCCGYERYALRKLSPCRDRRGRKPQPLAQQLRLEVAV